MNKLKSAVKFPTLWTPWRQNGEWAKPLFSPSCIRRVPARASIKQSSSDSLKVFLQPMKKVIENWSLPSRPSDWLLIGCKSHQFSYNPSLNTKTQTHHVQTGNREFPCDETRAILREMYSSSLENSQNFNLQRTKQSCNFYFYLMIYFHFSKHTLWIKLLRWRQLVNK